MFLYFPYDSFIELEQYVDKNTDTNNFSLAESRAKEKMLQTLCMCFFRCYQSSIVTEY